MHGRARPWFDIILNMSVLPLVLAKPDFEALRGSIQGSSMEASLDNIVGSSHVDGGKDIKRLSAYQTDIAILGSDLHLDDGILVEVPELPVNFGLHKLVAAVVNMAKPFAQLQSWVASLLRANPSQDDKVIKHGLDQLREARNISNLAELGSQFLTNIENVDMDGATHFDFLMKNRLSGYSDDVCRYFSEPIRAVVQAIYGLDYASDGDTVTTLGKIIYKQNQFQVKPDTDGFRFVSDESQVMSAEQIEAVNAIFNKACGKDLITLAP